MPSPSWKTQASTNKNHRCPRKKNTHSTLNSAESSAQHKRRQTPASTRLYPPEEKKRYISIDPSANRSKLTSACSHSRRTILPAPTSSVVNPSGFTVSVRPSLDTSNPPSTLTPSTNNAEKTGSPFFSKKSQKSLPQRQRQLAHVAGRQGMQPQHHILLISIHHQLIPAGISRKPLAGIGTIGKLGLIQHQAQITLLPRLVPGQLQIGSGPHRELDVPSSCQSSFGKRRSTAYVPYHSL